jgi:hypothetical protein
MELQTLIMDKLPEINKKRLVLKKCPESREMPETVRRAPLRGQNT